MHNFRNKIIKYIQGSIEVKNKIYQDQALLNNIEQSANNFIEVIKAKGTIYACGNGGSACDSIHLVEELVARYKKERDGIKAMHFIDGATLTCWSNDYEYETAFARQAKTFCTDKDLLLGISTSGNSENVLHAIEIAKQAGCRTVALLGRDGGIIKNVADLSIIVPSNETERIQESHIMILHIICELVEDWMLNV